MGLMCQCADMTGATRKDPKKKKLQLGHHGRQTSIDSDYTMLSYCGQRKSAKSNMQRNGRNGDVNNGLQYKGNPFFEMEDNQLQMILESGDIDNLDIKGPAFQAFRRYFRN